LTEVVSAFTRRLKGKSLAPRQTTKAKRRFRHDFRRKFFKLEINALLIERATDLAEKYALRGYDAVQLAAASTANEARIAVNALPLILVSADNDLNAAATAEGLAVENPNDYLMKLSYKIIIYLAIALGIAHQGFAVYGGKFNLNVLWFIGSGFAMIFAGFLNLALVRISPTDWLIHILCIIANLTITILFVVALLTVLQEPQVFVGISIFALLTVFSFLQIK
jgi:predicted nucleic acid-binding protein